MRTYRDPHMRQPKRYITGLAVASLLLIIYYSSQETDSELYRFFHSAYWTAPAVLICGFLTGAVTIEATNSLRDRLRERRQSHRNWRAVNDLRRRSKILAAGYYQESTRDKSQPPQSHDPSRFQLNRFQFPLHSTARELILKYSSLSFGNFVISGDDANASIRLRPYFLDAGLPDALPIGYSVTPDDIIDLWVTNDGRFFGLDNRSIFLLAKSSEEAIERMASEAAIPPDYPRWEFEAPLKLVPLIEAIPGPWNFDGPGSPQQTPPERQAHQIDLKKKRQNYLQLYHWEGYFHAYGRAEDASTYLAELTSEIEEIRQEAVYDFLWSSAYHQGDVFTVTPLVVRYVVMLLGDDDVSRLEINKAPLSRELIHFCLRCAEARGLAEVMAGINQALRGGKEIFQKWANSSDGNTAKGATAILNYLQKTGSESSTDA